MVPVARDIVKVTPTKTFDRAQAVLAYAEHVNPETDGGVVARSWNPNFSSVRSGMSGPPM